MSKSDSKNKWVWSGESRYQRPQISSWHLEEETQNTGSHTTAKTQVKQLGLSSLAWWFQN